MTTPRDPCLRCGVRWVQSWNGAAARLCRRCARETGMALTIQEIEAARIEKREQAIASKRVPESGPRPPIVKVIDGVAYEVTWDGS